MSMEINLRSEIRYMSEATSYKRRKTMVKDLWFQVNEENHEADLLAFRKLCLFTLKYSSQLCD